MTDAGDNRGAAIAVIGLALRVPGAPDAGAFWRNLMAGVESIRRFTPDELVAAGLPRALVEAPDYVPAKGWLAEADCFDAAFFGIPPRSAAQMDPQARLFLECAWQALEDAGCTVEQAGRRIGVFAGGAAMSSYYHTHLLADAETRAGADPFQLFLLNQPAALPTQVAFRLNLTGPALALQTACSTGLAAVAVACQNLIDLQCDVALAGAAALSLPLVDGYRHLAGSILSPDGHCRPFDAAAAGTVPGNGVGAVVLKRLDEALAEGDRIDAVIRGFAMNNDGRDKIGFTAPSAAGQAQAIADALAMAELPPATIGYLEAHGTATALGDAIELAALRQVFADAPAGACALGSVKGNIGHLDAAAGIAGLIKAVLALREGALPPSLHFQAANPELRLAGSPFRVQATARGWPRGTVPRRAGVSSFGMGGTNVHVVLEEGPRPKAAVEALRIQVLPLSAASPAALARNAAALAAHLEAGDDLAAVAATLQGRQALPRRLAVAAASPAEAARRLRSAIGMEAEAGAPVFLFPGQGAQHAGMAAGLARELPVFRDALEVASAGFAARGVALHAPLCAAHDDAAANAALVQTALAQPALFAVEYALARQALAWGLRPVACLGHSIGEYAALCLAGVLTLEDVLTVVVARGRLMQALPPGGMLSVRLDEAALRPLLPHGVEIAAINAPDLLVVSGPAGPLAAAQAAIEAAGGLCRPLRTSHAFHSAMMAPAEAAFRAVLRGIDFRPPEIPIVANLTGTWLSADEAMDPETWVRQLGAPVRFAEGVACLLTAGHRQALELGPGSALTTLFARQGGQAAPLLAPPQGGDDLQAALQALGQAWARGASPDWDGLWPAGRPTRVPLPPYSFERARHWVEAPGAVAPAPAPDVTSADGDGLEDRVIALWQRHLGHAAIGPEDDFHRLGGDSLLAVRLAADLNRACGGDLKPHDLLSHPTPRRLARRLSEGRDEAAAPTRVLLRPGQPGVAPLVLFHAVGGTVNLYADLVAALDPALPVVAFQSPLVAGGSAGPSSVEGMASDYLAAMGPRGKGPWRLAGSSFGGMLAFEAARQLIAAGESVELLALLDTPGPGDLPRELADDAEVLSYIARILGRPLEAAALRALAPEAMLGRFVAVLAERLPPGITGAEFAVYLAAFKLNTAAMRAYDPPPVAGLPRIGFFKARERDGDTPALPERAWQRLLGPDALEVIEVAGGHLSMMQAGRIDTVAAWLGDHLKLPAAA